MSSLTLTAAMAWGGGLTAAGGGLSGGAAGAEPGWHCQYHSFTYVQVLQGRGHPLLHCQDDNKFAAATAAEGMKGSDPSVDVTQRVA
jgi:hypothetical protein